MKWIGYLFSSLWRLWFLYLFLITFILVIPFLLFFTAVIKNNKKVCNLMRYWSRVILWFSGLFYRIKYEENFNKNEQYIFCANHVSTLDIPLISAALTVPILYIGKAELVKIPIFGYFFKHNSVIVNREKRKDSYQAFLNAGEKLEKGLNICMFPEGGIPKATTILKKFKNGPFRLALDRKIKIIPLTLINNKSHFPQEYYKGYPGRVKITVHKPVNPTSFYGEDSIKNLNNYIYNIILNELKKYES
ncbi:MAG: lysophospholipid acyltransferase family protein [Bacteroidota bacterium]|nr:lysophospholipid acyltransferase family protein [Bacteroidota bacterium]